MSFRQNLEASTEHLGGIWKPYRVTIWRADGPGRSARGWTPGGAFINALKATDRLNEFLDNLAYDWEDDYKYKGATK